MGRDRREPSLDGLNQRTQAFLSMMRVTDRGGGSSINSTVQYSTVQYSTEQLYRRLSCQIPGTEYAMLVSLCPFKSGLMNKHIVKNIVKLAGGG